jgi:hypothetical protein
VKYHVAKTSEAARQGYRDMMGGKAKRLRASESLVEEDPEYAEAWMECPATTSSIAIWKNLWCRWEGSEIEPPLHFQALNGLLLILLSKEGLP